MKYLYFCTLSFLSMAALFFPQQKATAQTLPLIWQRCYGGDSSDAIVCIKQTSDGGYVAAGSTRSSDGDLSSNGGIKGLWVLKLDGAGNIQWERTYNDTMVGANYIEPTTDGGYIVTGSQTLKLYNDGSIQWAKNIFGYVIHQAADGGYIVASYTYNLIKLDTAGNVTWQYNYAPSFDNLTVSDVCTSLADDGYVFTGAIVDLYASPYVAKVDNSGTLTAPIYADYLHGSGDHVCKTTDGHYLYTSNSTHQDSIIKLDASLSTTWQIVASGGSCISPTSDNGFITLSGGLFGNPDISLTKYDVSGSQQWVRYISGTQTGNGRFALQTTGGNYVIAGFVNQNDSEVSGVHGGSVDGWVSLLGYNTAVPTVKTNQADVKIYPVPATGQLFIDLPPGDQNATLKLIDVSGNTLMNETSNTLNRTLDLTHFAAGQYLLAVINNGSFNSYKVIHY